MSNLVLPVRYQNPDASEGLTLPLEIIENTTIEDLESNTRHNSSEYERWLQLQVEHERKAVLIGGGASINDHVEDIRKLQREGAIVFAMNGASGWAREHLIGVDYQVILDAKQESSGLVDQFADEHLFSSQCHPDTTKAAENLTLWHLDRPDIEDLFPEERVKAGGYVIVGGDSSVGVCALCLVYTQGYRDIHIFGYDTSHQEGKSHGYKQRMNDTMPIVDVEWAGKYYKISMALKNQCSNFMTYTDALKEGGCDFHVYGEGLLQAVYRTDVKGLSEKEKYRFLWMFRGYAASSPGQRIAEYYVKMFKPEGRVIDFGCGSGKGSIKLQEAGLEPILVDFADNCRDPQAEKLPFIECDLTEKIPLDEKYGFCTDVMEHIPEKDTDIAIHNIMASASEVFFEISTIDDDLGEIIGSKLHNTV